MVIPGSAASVNCWYLLPDSDDSSRCRDTPVVLGAAAALPACAGAAAAAVVGGVAAWDAGICCADPGGMAAAGAGAGALRLHVVACAEGLFQGLSIRSGLCSAVAGDGGSMLHDSAYRVDAVAKANHHSFVLKEVLVWCNLEPWTQELGRTVDCLLKITTPKP